MLLKYLSQVYYENNRHCFQSAWIIVKIRLQTTIIYKCNMEICIVINCLSSFCSCPDFLEQNSRMLKNFKVFFVIFYSTVLCLWNTQVEPEIKCIQQTFNFHNHNVFKTFWTNLNCLLNFCSPCAATHIDVPFFDP